MPGNKQRQGQKLRYGMAERRTGNGLSLLVERFERYGLAKGFGILRFAQDDSKNDKGNGNRNRRSLRFAAR
jgi:hypothetical protein